MDSRSVGMVVRTHLGDQDAEKQDLEEGSDHLPMTQ